MSPLGHNFACVAYLCTVASFWFREQLYSFNVVGFIFLVFTKGFSGFLFFSLLLFHFVYATNPSGEKVKI